MLSLTLLVDLMNHRRCGQTHIVTTCIQTITIIMGLHIYPILPLKLYRVTTRTSRPNVSRRCFYLNCLVSVSASYVSFTTLLMRIYITKLWIVSGLKFYLSTHSTRPTSQYYRVMNSNRCHSEAWPAALNVMMAFFLYRTPRLTYC